MVRKAVRLSITLMFICGITSLGLSLTFMVTRPRIDEQARKKRNKAIFSVMKGAESYQERRLGEDRIYFEVYKDGEVCGYALPVAAKGYSSTIKVMAGIDPQGKITGINIVSHEETPGLGSRIVEIKPGENEPWFTRQFRGILPEDLTLDKIRVITGASISSRAVVEDVREAVEKFKDLELRTEN